MGLPPLPKPSKKPQRDMVVVAEYKPEEILPWTGLRQQPEDFEIDGKVYTVRMDSIRYATFKRNLTCVTCGIEGKVMRLEHGYNSNPSRPHFNLYATKEDGSLLLMTRDHIIPRAHGGSDAVSNQQTMCVTCNVAKGDKLPT